MLLRIIVIVLFVLLCFNQKVVAKATGYAKEESEAAIDSFYTSLGIPRTLQIAIIERMGSASPLALKTAQNAMLALVQSKVLDAQEREIIDLAISYHNDCGFCIAFHKEVALKAGVVAADVEEVANGGLPKSNPLRTLVIATKRIMAKKGFLSRIDKAQFFSVGLNIAQLNEIGFHIGVYSAFNYVNHVNEADHPPKELVEHLKQYMAEEMMGGNIKAEL
jgi:AhpD family alkylhydroperoxidase